MGKGWVGQRSSGPGSSSSFVSTEVWLPDGRLEKEMSWVDIFGELCLFSEPGLGLQAVFPAHPKL